MRVQIFYTIFGGIIVKITAENNSEKTTLEDDAAIYAKRDERPASERFKDLKGEEKWQFFKDYALAKIIAGVVILALVISLLYSMFGPKPETIMYVAIINNPFDLDRVDGIKEDLTSRFVTDSKKGEITVDSDFYFMTNEYNARMKFMTLTAGKTIDFVIFPANEFSNYHEANTFLQLDGFLPASQLERLKVYEVKQDDAIYALDVTSYMNGLLGTELPTKYYVACISNSEHKELFEGFVDYIFGG